MDFREREIVLGKEGNGRTEGFGGLHSGIEEIYMGGRYHEIQE